MLLTLVMPTFMVVIFRFGAMNSARQSGHFLTRMSNMAFPATAAYALLVLTNLIYNNFGGDGTGVQFFYAAPVPFRQIVLGKNLTYAGILVANTLLAWFAVSNLYSRPSFPVTVGTLAGLLFAAPINFTVGNVLSFYSPKYVEFARFGRQRVSQITLLISLGVQFVVLAVGATVFWIARLYQNFWIAALLFLLLSTISFSIYWVALRFVDYIALKRRDTLLSELCRA
jgi:ABC-2 type transport system permease protein